MVPAGTLLTVDVQGTTGQFIPRTPSDLQVEVTNALTPYFDVLDVGITRESFLSDPLRLYYWNWPYKAEVRFRTRVEHAYHRDAASIVAHAFYGAAGDMPIVTVRGVDPAQTDEKVVGLSVFGVLALAVVGLLAIAAIRWKG